MRIAFFDTHEFEKPFFEEANKNHEHEIVYYETRLNEQTALLAKDFECACCFVNDVLDKNTLCTLSCENFKLIALRSAGFNNVDLKEASRLGLTVVRVPAYSPYSVAEHAVGLLLSLNRKLHKAYSRVRELNFSLKGLVGFDLHGKTVGVIGTGKIGSAFVRIMNGFGCKILAYDINPNKELETSGLVKYVELDSLLRNSDVISLHIPLVSETHHIIDKKALEMMKSEVVLVNTSRGALINSADLIDSLKAEKIGGAALDVYEEEEDVFFHDLSSGVLKDDTLARLMTFPNVFITSHQGFLTKEALGNIASTTLQNITDFQNDRNLLNKLDVLKV